MYETIYSWIRSRLQDSVANIEDSDFDREIESVLRALLTPWQQTYAGLSGDDLALVNEACGLICAARLLTPYSTGGANSDLRSESNEGPSEKVSRSYGDGNEKESWIKQANQAMALTSFVTNSGYRDYSRFIRGGYRRNWEENHANSSCCD